MPSHPSLDELHAKLESRYKIYKLRDDYKKAKGADFRLQKFHDDFVKQGGLPIKLIRKILLPGDTGPSL